MNQPPPAAQPFAIPPMLRLKRLPRPAPSPSPAPPIKGPLPIRPPRPLAPLETALPAPHSAPLPAAVPHPSWLPPFSPARPAMFLALAMLAATGLGCARLELTSAPDAGAGAPLASVSSVDPMPGAIEAGAVFSVTFATPMDASLLLSDVAASQTVVLVAQSNAQVMAAALAHARLTAAEEALLIPGAAVLGAQALSLQLTPARPLAPGDYALLIAARLKDATGAKLSGASEFDYSVAAVPPAPALLDPPAGSTAPENLSRVRVSFSAGASGSLVSIIGASGMVAAAVAPSRPGEAVIDLCPDAPCAALVAGQRYSLALDGIAVPGASFVAGSCARDVAPALLASQLSVRDSSASLALALDWPARVLVQLSPASGSAAGSTSASLDAGSDDAGSSGSGLSDAGSSDPGTCDGPGCSTSLFISCTTTSCGEATGCSATLSFTGLAAGASYTAQLSLEDDEGHRASLPPIAVTTLGALPSANLDEVMASPPLPEPRDEGEYLELVNTGAGAIDLSLLALQGPDGVVRPLLGAAPSSPLLLAPGGYALAVGASFDASRYALPAGVPVLRASTQRLLGRGLADTTPPAISLVALPASDSAPGAVPVLLSSFPGGTFHCAEGESFERVAPAPGAGQPRFACGAQGGSPGRAP